MKTIVMMPVKNEDWILSTTLKAAEQIADVIIVGDQMSTDRTREILAASEKVHIIDNTEVGHSNKIRWKMLDYMREKFGGNNLIINLDADEILPPLLFNKYKDVLLEHLAPGDIVSSPWVQVWRTVYTYRKDNSVWNPLTNKKPFIFLDDGKVDYNRTYVVNDHTSRVPEIGAGKTMEVRIPLLHLQFANWERTQVKQAWYQCCEVLKGKNPVQVTQSYRITKDEMNMNLKPVPELWYKGVEVSTKLESCDVKSTWYFKEIVEIFNEHGVDKFKDLGIWHIPQIKSLLTND